MVSVVALLFGLKVENFRKFRNLYEDVLAEFARGSCASPL